ncbi:hypothetical protein [Salinicola sp. RZ23]|uniref:DUF2515 family protein n=1 Tax=Salinicola sp. RZ23 TaxID=1949087 RepID=UPI0013001D1E|nr:hypothetical protein [Salinicola sp. RZ23]
MEHEFKTNSRACSVQMQEVSCSELWSLGQQEAIRKLSVLRKGFFDSEAHYELISKFSERAKVIAGVYARFYLEQEDGCAPDKEGRFYWMGLAAFASKQVMCALQFSESLWLWVTNPSGVGGKISKNYLGEGNFWLFQDIFVWHWFYANHSDCYECCFDSRDSRLYSSSSEFDVLGNVAALPWADDALEKVNYFRINEYVSNGFSLIREMELDADPLSLSQARFDSLLQIAFHEQLKILQPLIYDNFVFARVLDAQEIGESVDFFNIIPRRVASFSIQCDIGDDNKDKEVAMQEGDLYNEVDRMIFIRAVAVRYHQLMENDQGYMRSQISAIASW